DSRIYVAGHTGLLGSGLCRMLGRDGYKNVVTRSHAELELTDAAAVAKFFERVHPEYVFLAAGLAGGIHRNKTQPAELIRANLAIQTNVIHQAHLHGVRKLLFVGSACAYPKHCDQPIRPETLLTGPLEPTSEAFAVAKIAGIRMCQAYNAQYGTQFIPVIPATMYGPNDHFDENGHVVSALMSRLHKAKASGSGSAAVWGTGRPQREFLYVDDVAEAMVFLMNNYNDGGLINIGAGEDISVAALAKTIAKVVGFEGRITFDTSRPDGMARRLLDSGRITQLGWHYRTPLADGLARTYAWYLQQL
ncbi:MAG: GDP-L-fucose synthase, partial [Phycisphaerae bacterium]|nr:GDP-L-fucose synthase [Phycisphaerae bacterium]